LASSRNLSLQEKIKASPFAKPIALCFRLPHFLAPIPYKGNILVASELEQPGYDEATARTRRQDAIKLLVLDMLSTTRAVTAERTGALNEADWAVLCTMARQHRLAPLLHHRNQTLGRHWIVPPEVRDDWAASFRHSALRALTKIGVLRRLNCILREADIPYAALKGAWLSQHAYSDPALRPMRDIDIVVEPDHALETFKLLRDHGFTQTYGSGVPLEYALKHAKHLPPLQCPSTGVSIEIHTRLFGSAVIQTDQFPLNNVKALLKNAEYHKDIPYLSSIDALLHLVVHAVYDHKFNNGPLIFSDVSLLIEKSKIDWREFWLMAKEGSWERGCFLVLHLASLYHHIEGWRDEGTIEQMPSSDVAKCASLMALQDLDQRGVVGFRSKLAASDNWIDQLHIVLRRILFARYTVTAVVGSHRVTSHTIFRNFGWLWSRAREMLSNRAEADVTIAVRHATRVNRWLNESEC
jgi:hypothetical protein